MFVLVQKIVLIALLIIIALVLIVVIILPVWIGVKKIWKGDFNFFKAAENKIEQILGHNPTSTPANLEYRFIPGLNGFETGVKVDGVTWGKDLQNYIFQFQNKGKTELSDLRIELEIPGTFVQYAVDQTDGVNKNDITFSGGNGFAGAGPEGVIKEILKTESNVLGISAPKIFSNSSFTIKLITRALDANKKGVFIIKYSTIDSDGNKSSKRNDFPLLINKNGRLYIDTANPLQGQYERMQSVRFFRDVEPNDK